MRLAACQSHSGIGARLVFGAGGGECCVDAQCVLHGCESKGK